MRGKLLGGRYQFVETLATGGFGQTYIAEDVHRPGNPQCVVKHLKPASVNSEFVQNARRLFQSEAETLERLGNHDQIPRLLAYFEENQEFYLVQELIQGHTLGVELQSSKRWSESQVCQLLQEVLSILVFVHGQGVIHRDIKPDNLIRRQQDHKLVLVDFGSVKQVWTQVVTNQGQTSSTFASSLPATIAIGTPGYMPTEQGRGKPRPNSDIYALGMIAIQAITGTSPAQLVEDSENGEIVWRNYASVSDQLAAILTKMVRYHFKNRYQTAAEALQAVQIEAARVRTLLSNDQVLSYSIIAENDLSRTAQNKLLAPEKSHKAEVEQLTILSSLTASPQPLLPVCSGVRPETTSSLTATAVSTIQPTIISPLEPQASSLHQTSIPSVPKISKTKDTPPQNYLRMGVAATAMLVSTAIAYAYAIYWQPRVNTQETLAQIATLKTTGNYEKCINQAATVSRNSFAYKKAQSLLHECRLSLAQHFATVSIPTAITEANKIPQDATVYQAAQKLISQWSTRMLQVAKNEYQLGKLNQAIATAQAIPTTTPIYQQAQSAIRQWQGEWQKNNSYWQAANNALQQGKWQNALKAAQQVTEIDYWQEKTKPIIEKATSKIAGSKPAVTSQTKSYAVRRLAPTTPRRLNSSTTRTPVRSNPKQAIRTVPKRAIATSPKRTIRTPVKRRRLTPVAARRILRTPVKRRRLTPVATRRILRTPVKRRNAPIANKWLRRANARGVTHNVKKVKPTTAKQLARSSRYRYASKSRLKSRSHRAAR